MISHRLSTLGNVDEIIVLKDGRIVEQGTYKDLKKQGGIFAGLLEEQNCYNIEKIGEQSILRSAFVLPDRVGQRRAQSSAVADQHVPVTPAGLVDSRQAEMQRYAQPSAPPRKMDVS